MKSTDQLFADTFGPGLFADAINEALELDEAQFSDDQLRQVFSLLPAWITDMAHEWGLDDSDFRDQAGGHMIEYAAGFKKVLGLEAE